MSREIKFRVWDKEGKRFIYSAKGYQGHYILTLDGKFHDLQNGSGGDDYEVQSFVGLQDKNNKDIYEGDIVTHDFRYHFDITGERKGVVKFENGGFSPLPKDHIEDEDDFYSYYVTNYQVIGNIFENPDLLK